MMITLVRHLAQSARFMGQLFLLLSCMWWSGSPASAGTPAVHSFRVYLPVVVNPDAAILQATMFEQQVVKLTNQLRQQHGCTPLTVAPALATAARAHSQEMATKDYLDHIN